jgi:hypothetical protein
MACSLLVRQPVRLRRDHTPFGHGYVLGARAALDAEHVVADQELAHDGTEGFDLASELGAEDRPPRAANAGKEPGEPILDAANSHGVAPRHGRGVDPNQHLVFLRHRPRDLADAQNLRRAVPIVDNRSHRRCR